MPARWLVLIFSFLPLIFLVSYLKANNPENAGSRFLPCIIQKSTGLYCPGCGSTRAAHHLLNLEPTSAIRKNAAFVIALPFILFGGLVLCLRWLRPQQPTPFDSFLNRLPRPLPLWVLGILLAYGVARNLPFPPFSALAPH